MSILIYRDPKSVGACAATLLASHILRDPSCTIGVDYHENLLPVYDSLSAMTENGLLNWSETHVFQLFEFLADETKEQRIANLLGKALFAKTEISDAQYRVPFSAIEHAAEAADAYEKSITDAGGLDAALIAVRQDGSLLMNRGTDADPFTHPETEDGNGFITVGLSAIMQTKHPIIVAIGGSCAQSVRTMLKGNLTESPLSALKLHAGATFILDEEAGEMLLHSDN